MIWVYYMDEFAGIDFPGEPDVQEMVNIARAEAKRRGVSGDICYLEIGNYIIVEVRPQEGAAVKLIRADNPAKALEEFYRHERECAVYSLQRPEP
ncbi:MAG: hypothetical protein ACP5LW_06490 [Nitrososphaeria archaeon]